MNLLLILLLLTTSPALAITRNFNVIVSISGNQAPGPSASLYASNPYYTCVSNKYVSVGGSSGNSGNSPASAWNLATASAYAAPPGTCINLAPGTYNVSGGGLAIVHGGTSSTSTTYVVWRCTSMAVSFVSGALAGEGSGCVFTDTTDYAVIGISAHVSYVMFDAIEVAGTPSAGTGGVCLDNENSGNVSATSHHIWVFNSDFHGCGLGGIVWNYTDWLFVIHNVWHDNSTINGVCGSGLSFFEPAGLTGYTPTAGHNDYWHSSVTGRTYNMVVAYNVGYRNSNPPTAPCSGGRPTDGNGIIMDSFDWGGSCSVGSSGATCPYAGNVLIMGNIMWGNGGRGIEVFSMLGPPAANAHIDIINNTTYSNEWDHADSGTWGGNLYAVFAKNVTWWNNIGISASGTRTCGAASVVQTGFACSALDQDSAASTDSWHNNVTYPASLYGFDGNNSYPLSGANSNLDGSDPRLVALNPMLSTGSTAVSNFALCTGAGAPAPGCIGTSPAVGLGQAFDLWQQSGSIDVGACVRGLANCP